MAIMLLITPGDAGGFGLPVWVAVVIALIITLLTGFFNGVLVMSTRLPSFIITLGSLFIFRGLAVAIPRLMTNRTQLGGFSRLRRGGLGGPVRHQDPAGRRQVRHRHHLVDRHRGGRHHRPAEDPHR